MGSKFQSLIFALATLLLFAASCARAQNAEPVITHETTFDFVVKTVAEQYYDSALKGLDWKAITEKYRAELPQKKTQAQFYRHLNAMLETLNDSHTRVVPKAAAQTQANLAVSVGARGIRLGRTDQEIFVREIVAQSPAQRAGLRVGDIVQSVAGEKASTRFSRAYDALEATIESRRTETALHRVLITGAAQALELTVGRDEVNTKISVSAEDVAEPSAIEVRALSSDIAHILLRRFRVDTLPIIATAMDARAPRGYVIDLRGNDGGDLAVATGFAERLFAQRVGLAIEISRRGGLSGLGADRREQIWMVGGKLGAREEPVAILIDARCASACEVFAAALQEHGRARIFGHASAGIVAGISPRPIEMPDGGGLNLSRLGILSPRGKVLDNVGVEPDESCPITLADVRAGKDCVMEQAEKWLRGQIAY